MSENDSLIMPNHHKDNALTFEPCSRACLGVSGAKQKVSSMIFSAHRIALVSSIKKNIMTIFSLMDTMSILLGCLTSAIYLVCFTCADELKFSEH